jgi:hypothetical protein
MCLCVFLVVSVYQAGKHTGVPMMDDMAKVTVTLYMDEEDKEALQRLADAQERSLSQMAVLILKRAIRQAQERGEIPSNKEPPTR